MRSDDDDAQSLLDDFDDDDDAPPRRGAKKAPAATRFDLLAVLLSSSCANADTQASFQFSYHSKARAPAKKIAPPTRAKTPTSSNRQSQLSCVYRLSVRSERAG